MGGGQSRWSVLEASAINVMGLIAVFVLCQPSPKYTDVLTTSECEVLLQPWRDPLPLWLLATVVAIGLVSSTCASLVALRRASSPHYLMPIVSVVPALLLAALPNEGFSRSVFLPWCFTLPLVAAAFVISRDWRRRVT